MRIFFFILTTLLFFTACGSNTQESNAKKSGEFISDAKSYLPPKPPGFQESSSKGDQ